MQIMYKNNVTRQEGVLGLLSVDGWIDKYFFYQGNVSTALSF